MSQEIHHDDNVLTSPQTTRTRFHDNLRLICSFFIFGLINNVVYVIILSAAGDLVGPLVPKSIVLIADILPSLSTKLIVPYLRTKVNYKRRIILCVILSFLGMQIIAWGNQINLRIFGIILASFSSGLGEMTFLQFSTKFPNQGLGAFASGTGGAGLIGALAFLILTSWIRISIFSTLLLLSFLPFLMIFGYFVILPTRLFNSNTTLYTPVPVEVDENDNHDTLIEDENENEDININISGLPILKKLSLVKPLIIPYMLPLLIVYFAEYLINQGIAPTLLFSIDQTPFKQYRDFYVTYQMLYQLGVFISRSSVSFVPFPNKPGILYIPSLMQFILLILFISQAIYFIIPSVWIVMILVLFEGCLGGLAYANAYWQLVRRSRKDELREFEMGVVGVADGIGILFAAFIGLWLEPILCEYQIHHGREWCKY